LNYRESVLELLGNTPMISSGRLWPEASPTYSRRQSTLNPSGILKDRIALEMIGDAEARGDLKPGCTIIEASTENTGTALSFVGTQLGQGGEIHAGGDGPGAYLDHGELGRVCR